MTQINLVNWCTIPPMALSTLCTTHIMARKPRYNTHTDTHIQTHFENTLYMCKMKMYHFDRLFLKSILLILIYIFNLCIYLALFIFLKGSFLIINLSVITPSIFHWKNRLLSGDVCWILQPFSPLKGMENSVINDSSSCCSKPLRPSFIFGTQIKIFLMNSESSLTLPYTAWILPRWRSRNVGYR